MRQGREQLGLWVAEQLAGTGMVQCELVIGRPFVELVEAYYRHDADLLVLGTHGIEGTDDRTGTVASKCARKAPIPVMLVRFHQERPFQTIAACLDFSETSPQVVREAAAIARRFEAGLKFVHVIRPEGEAFSELTALSYAIPSDGQTGGLEQARSEMEEFLSQFSEEFVGLNPEQHIVESKHPSDGITRFAKDQDVDLLVLASRGRTGANWLLMGTTAEKVIHSTPCSILVIKPEDFQAPRGV